MRCLTVIFVLCLMPLAAFADGPATAPAFPNPRAKVRPEHQRPRDDAKDLEDARAFLVKHSPKRAEVIARVQERLDEDKKARLRDRMLAYYRGIQAMRTDGNKDVFELRLKQVTLEDDIFGCHLRLMEIGGRQAEGPEADKIRAELKEKVRDLVGNRLSERAVRLKRMKKWTEEEQERLARDEQNKEALIEFQVKQELEGRPTPLFPDGPNAPFRKEREKEREENSRPPRDREEKK